MFFGRQRRARMKTLVIFTSDFGGDWLARN